MSPPATSADPNNQNGTFSTGPTFPGLGRAGVRPRPKPRLVKLRRCSKPPAPAVINPFKSVCSEINGGGVSSGGGSNVVGSNLSFVFGVSGSSNCNGSNSNVYDDGSNSKVYDDGSNIIDNGGELGNGCGSSSGHNVKEGFSFGGKFGELGSSGVVQKEGFTFGGKFGELGSNGVVEKEGFSFGKPEELSSNGGVQKEGFSFRKPEELSSSGVVDKERVSFSGKFEGSNSSGVVEKEGFSFRKPEELNSNGVVQRESFSFGGKFGEPSSFGVVQNEGFSRKPDELNSNGVVQNEAFIFRGKPEETSSSGVARKEGFSFSGKPEGLSSSGVVQKEGFSFSGKLEESSLNGVGDLVFTFGAGVGDQCGVSSGKCGVSGEGFGLSEEMRKLNIEKNEKGGFSGVIVEEGRNGDVANGGEQVFVFQSGRVGSGGTNGCSVPIRSEANGTSLNGTTQGSHSVKDDVFVFGSSGKSAIAGDFPSFGFQAAVNGVKAKEDVFRTSYLFSSLGAEVGGQKPEACTAGEEKVEFSSESAFEGNGASFPEFKLSDFDAPLSFSANLPGGLGGKLDSSVRTRGLRETFSKKTKGKSKHSKLTKQQGIQDPQSGKNSTEDQEAYSPMDFSPYEETTAENDVPLSGHQATGEADVRSGILSAMYTESEPKQVFSTNGQGFSSTDSKTTFSTNISGLDGIGAQFSFSTGEEKIAFTTSETVQKHVSSAQRQQKKKYRLRTAPAANRTSMARDSSFDGTPRFSKNQGQSGNAGVSTSKGKYVAKGDREQGSESLPAFSAAEKACDKWRRRGNEAYEKGELSEAEDFYTFGVNCVPPAVTSGVAFTPLVRCYSNRAATRMALGRVREAIQDCHMAAKLDPTFHRAKMRAANCYLQLGELEIAMKCFRDCMDSAANLACLDRQVILLASEGVQKSQKVIDCTNRSAELLKLRTSEAAASALDSIVEAMSISIYSEELIEMKADALCLLRRHDEAITLSRQTLEFAEKNFTVATPGDVEANGSCLNVRLWRHRILLKCHFHLGKLEVALDLIEKQESGDKTQEQSDQLAVTIRELIRQKSAGNTAFQSGRHAEAIEYYTSAILSSMDSRPFAAICFCNRAASYQAMGNIADAISDCSLAIALDENYAKAVSRRATLHEMIRDYKQAAADLQRLSSLLQKQSLERTKQSGSGNGKELRQVQHRLSTMEEEAKREVPLDFYLILGIKKSDSACEIKKAYRKAALRHHPDKAGQSLARSDVGDEGRHWKDIAELVYKDSDRLFKMIGEAYAVLSDPTKREDYDHEEEMRKALRESNNIRSSPRRQSYYNGEGFPFDRSSNRRHWQDSYRTYTYSHKRW